MKKKQHITAFYLETLLMIVVFIAIILVLTRVFGSARVQSTRAKRLTAAVTLAQNAAEAVSAAQTPQDLVEILNEGGNAILQEDAAAGAALVTAAYDGEMNPVAIAPQDPAQTDPGTAETGAADLLRQGVDLIVETTWAPAESGMVESVVTVFDGHTGKAIYTLNTSAYISEQE